ncbi:MAG: class I SAM-dependent methyltransferase [Rhodospirillaceae bacterium]
MANTLSPAEIAHEKDRSRHLKITLPSPWVVRFRHLVTNGARVLDLAAGGGRHGRMLLEQAAHVTFVDRDAAALTDLAGHDRARVIEADLEGGLPPFGPGGVLAGLRFDVAVVVNYLHRPLLAGLVEALDAGGVLIYETFARGNEAYSRPRNPDHLLKSGELLAAVAGRMQVVAYEHGVIQAADIPGVKQRLCAIKDLANPKREDDDPPPHSLAPGVD